MKLRFITNGYYPAGDPVSAAKAPKPVGHVVFIEKCADGYTVETLMYSKDMPPSQLIMNGGELVNNYSVVPEAEGTETVNHPAHYGGADNPYEAIKVIENWRLGFSLGNAVKYISRAGKKAEDPSGRLGHADQEKLRREKLVEDLKKAAWYLNREIESIEGKKEAPAAFITQRVTMDSCRREGALAAMDDAMGIAVAAQASIDGDLSRGSEQRPTTYIDGIRAKLIRRREEIDKGLPRRG